MADEGDDVITDEERRSIVKKFLLRAPPGEIQAVSKDVMDVLNDDELFDSVAPDTFREWNTDQMLAIDLPSGLGEVIITRHGEIDRRNYLDPRSGRVATVDHVQQICTHERVASLDELAPTHVEEYRGSLDAALVAYVGEAFPDGKCAVYYTGWASPTEGGGVNGIGSIQLTAVIAAVRLSPQNYWNGLWRSVWTVDVNLEHNTADMRGHIRADAHYFEEGNVQLKANYECAESCSIEDAESSGRLIGEVIAREESRYLVGVEEFYAKLSNWQFKELRRKLPVTRTTFPWSNKNMIQIASELSGKKTPNSKDEKK